MRPARRTVLVLLMAGLLAGAAHAQVRLACEDEIGALRWLVQKYSADRAQLEFALATSEARRQAAEADLARLKSAPVGQK